MKTENFKEAKERVEAGKSVFIIASYTKPMIITSNNMKQWKDAGMELISVDGNGFRMRKGKSSVFLFDNALIERAI